MGKLEGTIKSEIVRLAKKEICVRPQSIGSGCPVIEEHDLPTTQNSLGIRTISSPTAKGAEEEKGTIGSNPGRG